MARRVVRRSAHALFGPLLRRAQRLRPRSSTARRLRVLVLDTLHDAVKAVVDRSAVGVARARATHALRIVLAPGECPRRPLGLSVARELLAAPRAELHDPRIAAACPRHQPPGLVRHRGGRRRVRDPRHGPHDDGLRPVLLRERNGVVLLPPSRVIPESHPESFSPWPTERSTAPSKRAATEWSTPQRLH